MEIQHTTPSCPKLSRTCIVGIRQLKYYSKEIPKFRIKYMQIMQLFHPGFESETSSTAVAYITHFCLQIRPHICRLSR